MSENLPGAIGLIGPALDRFNESARNYKPDDEAIRQWQRELRDGCVEAAPRNPIGVNSVTYGAVARDQQKQSVGEGNPIANPTTLLDYLTNLTVEIGSQNRMLTMIESNVFGPVPDSTRPSPPPIGSIFSLLPILLENVAENNYRIDLLGRRIGGR